MTATIAQEGGQDVWPAFRPMIEGLGAVRVERVPSRFANTIHTYAAVCPWDPAGDRLLYAGFDDAEGVGQLVVWQRSTGEECVLAELENFDFHDVAEQRWALGGKAVIYRGTDPSGQVYPALVGVDGRDHRLFDDLPGYYFRQVLPDGCRAILYGKPHAVPRECGIRQLDLETGSSELLVTAAEIESAFPLDDGLQGTTFLNHPVVDPRGRYMFFKRLLFFSKEEPTLFRGLYVQDLQSGRIYDHGSRVSGHPAWSADGQHILNIAQPQDESRNRWLIAVDPVTGQFERLIDNPFEGPGHPAPSPDGRWIAMDAFTPDGKTSPLYLIDRATGRVTELARLNHHFQGGFGLKRVTRSQPHPAWSPDGRALVINWNQGGRSVSLLIINFNREAV